MNILKLSKDFTQLLNDELSPELIAKINRLNVTAPIPFGCHSHDFCDPNQVMIDAMAKQQVEFEAQDFEQGRAINQAWDLAKKANFDPSNVIFLAAGCVTIGSKRADGDIRLLCTINNNDDELSSDALARLINHVVSCYQLVEVEAEVFLRQDCVDYISPEESVSTPESEDVVTDKIAFELVRMGVTLAGYTTEQYAEAKRSSDRVALLVWSMEDVLQQAEDDQVDLTDEQAQMVLDRIASDHDAGIGCNWDVVSSLIGQVVG